MNAFIVNDIRIGPAHSCRTMRTVIVDDHFRLAAFFGKFPKEALAIGIAAIHEVDLEALHAQFGKMLDNTRLVACSLCPCHPKNDSNAFFCSIINQIRHIDIRMVFPDVELFAPSLIENDVLHAILGGKIDKPHISFGSAALRIALVVESIPPIPRNLARLYPREIMTLRRRTRNRPDDVRFAQLRRRIGENKRAPRECASRICLDKIIAKAFNLHPTPTFFDRLQFRPACDIGNMRSLLRPTGEKRIKYDPFAIRARQVPNRIIKHIRLGNRYRLAANIVDKRQINHFLSILSCLDLSGSGRLRNSLLASEAPSVVKPTFRRCLRHRQRGGFAEHLDASLFLGLEPIGDAVIARYQAHAPIAIVGINPVPGKIDFAFFVNWR